MNRYHDSLNSVREFARFNSVPQNIEARIMEFMITTWQQTKDRSSKKILSELHESLVPYKISVITINFIIVNSSKGIDTNAVLNLCPKDLKSDICVHLHRRVFNGNRCFLEASDACLRSLALEFQTIHISAGFSKNN